MNKYLILFLLAGLFLFSCSKEEEIMEEEIFFPFAGNWSGTISGDLTGTLTLFVKNDAKVSVLCSIPGRGTASFSGEVTEIGTLEANSAEADGDVIKISGSFETITGIGSWTLVNTNTPENLKGNWTVEKN